MAETTQQRVLVLDPRAIPIPPSLAICLSYIPGVDDRDARDKSKPRKSHLLTNEAGQVIGVKESQRGLVRAAVAVQLHHRLWNSAPTDTRLVVMAGRRWYARSYAEWYLWDLQFIPQATLTKAFQDLRDAGVIKGRSEDMLVADDPRWREEKRFMRMLSVYNRLAWTVDEVKLAEMMAANVRVQAYFDGFRAPISAEESVQGSDQDDQTVRSGRSEGSDQDDQTVRSGRSEISISDQNQTQLGDQPSAAARAGTPLSAPTPGRSDLPENGNGLRLDDTQTTLYAKLTAHHVDTERAIELIKTRKPEQIEAWLDYIRRANTPGSNIKAVANPGGFLVRMLDHPDNYPRPKKQIPVDPGERFLAGQYGNEIEH